MKPSLLLNDFLPQSGDLCAAFIAALQEAGGGNVTLRLNPGTYMIKGDGCGRKFRAISNHDSGEYSAAFDLTGLRDVEFDGGGARLLFVGRVIPFWVKDAERIALRNFTVDWERAFFTEGRIVESEPFKRAVLEIDRALYPLEITAGKLRFTGRDYESDYLSNAMEVDAGLMEFADYSKEAWGFRLGDHEARELEGGLIELKGPFQSELRVGNIIAMTHEKRTSPVMAFTRTHGITVQDVTLHCSGGMGLIAQMCSDIRVQNMVARPSPERRSFMSLDADATHFVECWGRIHLSGCRFSGQMDDSLNCHGVYLRVAEVAGEHEFVAEAAHFQQHHVDYFAKGESINLIEPATYETLATFEIVEARRLDGVRTAYRVSGSLPAGITGKAIGGARRDVDLLVEDGRFEKHRARGLLLSAPGRMHVRNCYFHVPGNGILSTCDCLDWFEAGPVSDLLVEDNEFDRCGYGPRLNPTAVRIGPAIPAGDTTNTPVQRNVTIRRNVFRGKTPFIALHRTEDVTISDNTYLPDSAADGEDQFVQR